MKFAVLCLALCACGSSFTPQDAVDVSTRVKVLDTCEDQAREVQKTQCVDGGPCQPGYDAYLACKKDGGV